jgi:cellulose synthase/poly-beta-1,6-N-acetylglucosamine synthase-like glycosyltransferase
MSGRPGDPFLEVSELLTRQLQASTQARLHVGLFLPSNNLACRRALAVEHPFDERYPTAAAEDRAWCARLVAAGRLLALEPQAVVAHAPVLGLRAFWSQQVRYGRGAFTFRRSRQSAAWREPPGFYLGLLQASRHHGPLSVALVLLAQLAIGSGFLLQALRQRTERQP